MYSSAFTLARTVTSLALVSAAFTLTGCAGFFVYPGSVSGGSTTTTTTDYAYVANSATGSTYINGYSIGTGALTAATNSPFSLGYQPVAMVLNKTNGILFIASSSTTGVGYVYAYGVQSGGSLSILNSQSPVLTENVAAMDVSPDGQWLFLLDTNGTTLNEYSINSSTGALALQSTYALSGATGGIITPSAIKVAPSGTFFAAALGTGGLDTFSFTTSTGAGAPSTLVTPSSSATGIYGLTIDSNNILYAAGTAGLQTFSTTSAGVPTFLQTYATGNGARAVAVNSTATFAFVANTGDGTISSFAIASGGGLTALPGSPTTAPTSVTALGVDGTNTYLLATGYNATAGTQIYSFASTGLTSKGSATTGTTTTVNTALALTH